MTQPLLRFMKDESGAITVDWVVLTAAIVALNLIVMFTPIRNSLSAVADHISGQIEAAGEYLPAGDE